MKLAVATDAIAPAVCSPKIVDVVRAAKRCGVDVVERRRPIGIRIGGFVDGIKTKLARPGIPLIDGAAYSHSNPRALRDWVAGIAAEALVLPLPIRIPAPTIGTPAGVGSVAVTRAMGNCRNLADLMARRRFAS